MQTLMPVSPGLPGADVIGLAPAGTTAEPSPGWWRDTVSGRGRDRVLSRCGQFPVRIRPPSTVRTVPVTNWFSIR